MDGRPIAFHQFMRATKIGFEQIQAPVSKVQDVFAGLYEHGPLATLVRTMALELERLDEDNKQLRAAILMYCEVARRTQPESAIVKAESVDQTPSATEPASRLDCLAPVMRQLLINELPDGILPSPCRTAVPSRLSSSRRVLGAQNN